MKLKFTFLICILFVNNFALTSNLESDWEEFKNQKKLFDAIDGHDLNSLNEVLPKIRNKEARNNQGQDAFEQACAVKFHEAIIPLCEALNISFDPSIRNYLIELAPHLLYVSRLLN